MTTGAPVPPKTRARIIAMAREGKLSRNAIAREFKLSPSTVTRICQSAKPPVAFDRGAIAPALAAVAMDYKAQRAVEAQASLDLAREFRDRMFTPRVVSTTDGQGNVVTYDLDPGPREWKETMTAYGIALDKHMALAKFDSDDRDLPAVDKWLAAMTAGAEAFAGVS